MSLVPPSAAWMPSMVVTDFPVTLYAGVWQDLINSSSTMTEQEPQSPLSQPIFVPVNPNWSRSRLASVVWRVASQETGFPFKIKLSCSMFGFILFSELGSIFCTAKARRTRRFF